MKKDVKHFMADLEDITVFTIMEQTEDGNYEILFTANNRKQKIEEINKLIEKCKIKYDIKNVANVGVIPLENERITQLYRASLIPIEGDHWLLNMEVRTEITYYKATCSKCGFSTKWFKNINTVYKLQKKHDEKEHEGGEFK